MRNRIHWISAAAMAAGLITGSEARASSHREALAILSDPCVDNTDVYAWVTPGAHDKLYLIAGYNGVHEPGQGNQQTRLCDNVLYEFHLARGNTSLEDAVTYQILLSTPPPTRVDTTNLALPPGGGKELLVQFGGQQTYTVTKIVTTGATKTTTVIGTGLTVAPPNVGPRTDRIVYQLGAYNPTDPASSETGLYDDAFAATFIHPLGTGGDEGRAWVGTRDDGFYLDEKGIFDVVNLTGAPRRSPGEDVFAGFNLNVIALEIPTTKVTGTGAAPAHNGTPGNDTLLGVWASASRRKFRAYLGDGTAMEYGNWVQVSREGLPLINAAVVGIQDQGKYLRNKPKNDVNNFGAYFLNPILVRDAEFLGTYDLLGVPPATVAALKTNRTDILDVINLTNIPTAGAHAVPIMNGKTGDVLRVDIAIDSGFPNGRPLVGGAAPNKEQADVSDVLISLIVAGSPTAGIGDGVNYNDKNYLTEFPFEALPWQGLNEGHGAATPPM